jgi:hypothetical protein
MRLYGQWPVGYVPIGVALIVVVGAVNAQSVRHVDIDAPAGGDGLSWRTAFNDLQAALAAAVGNPSITQLWIAEGTYTPAPPGGSRAATFTLRHNLGLYGGFAGGETSLEQRDIAAHVTTLSGDLNGDGPGVFTGLPPSTLNDNSFHVVTGMANDPSARLDGLSIVGGGATGPASDGAGAGLQCIGSSPTVDHCTFAMNYAREHGGAVNIFAAAHVTFTFCHFENNRTILDAGGLDSGGGAIRLYASGASISDSSFHNNRFVAGANAGAILSVGSTPTITRCEFVSNGEPGSFTGVGGAMYIIDGSAAMVADCTFTGNRAAGGGSIAIFDSQALIRDCLFERGDASFHAEGGGGIANWSDETIVVDCTFDGLVAEGGGAMTNVNASPSIVNCRFIGNQCFLFDGGAMWNTGDSAPLIVNCIFSGNASTSGSGGSGAIFHDATGSLLAANCTFVGNSANPSLPGAGALVGAGTTLRNCIVVHNTPGQLHSSVAATYSCIEGGWSGAGNLAAASPGFVDELGADDIPGTLDDDLRLVESSPCIDAARNEDVPADVADIDDDGDSTEVTPLDLAMRGRFYDRVATPDTGAGTPPIVDMGAFEFHPPCAADITLTGGSLDAIDIDDLLAVISAWGPCPAPPALCPANIVTAGASATQVDIDDLLAVIGAWGPCP